MRWLVLSCLLVACGGESAAPEPPPPAPAPPPPPPVVAARPISSRASFDLVALPDGAALAWGATPNDGGGVRAIALDPNGGVRGHEVVVSEIAFVGGGDDPGSVEELAIAAAGHRVAVAWIARSGPTVRAIATIASAGVDGFAPVRDLGASVAGAYDRSTRGRVAAWGRDDGSAMIVLRAPPGPCQASAGECARFALASIGDGEGRDAIVNEVREPCDPLVVGGIARGSAFFYGACHVTEQGAPTTTLYAIDRGGGGALASAPDVVEGCVPIGIAPGASGAIAIGRCDDGIAAQEVGPRGDLLGAARAATPRVVCASGRPTIELGAIRVPLVEAMSRIEGLLPASVAPEGSRAVWTGDAILVAAPSGREVALRRYQCEVDSITRTDVR
ncbi:hypothetical protein [Sandaracinus amylolyticus]|uniref:hypothetical protein n=1 Tax=Sandaracinus amylolyticus TaxID=927083 RepID=UPI001F1B8004|nr:hypothetical protein [Sandaracinus amylolyticus]UJR80529.1 Hypothetical protein I5071_25760 [Sandaracinus amylolyticus]